MRAVLLLLAWGGLCAGCASQRPPAGIGASDFFFYSCVDAYLVKHALPRFDSSMGYAVEYGTLSAEAMTRQHRAATAAAHALPAPDWSDAEHGRAAVLVHCQRAARRQGATAPH